MTASGRVDLVRNPCGEQADGRKLFGLGELGFEVNAIGDVVDQDDAAYCDEVARDQRCNRDVGDAYFAGRQSELKLVQRMRALFLAHAVEASDELRREDVGDVLA